MTGRLLKHRAVIADQLEITISRESRRIDQVNGWWGELWLSTAIHVLPGDELTLDSPETGLTPIVIERVTVDSKAGKMLVRFAGSGPLLSS
jgi:hypothetical protein